MAHSGRRDFIKTLAMGVAGAATVGTVSNSNPVSAQEKKEHGDSLIQPGNTILFQGDSITDAGRSRPEAGKPNNQKALGNGYAWMAASQLLVGMPEAQLKIYNRGISGNKVFQLADRWDKDCLELKPDVLSILIGVNDIWHYLNGKYDGTVETYETDFRALLERTRKELPEVKLVICEPFVLKCGAVDDKWFPLFDQFRKAASEVANDFHTVFVPFQSMFDEAINYAPPEHWAKDGVHPSPFGAQLMAHEWVKTVSHAHQS